MIRSTRPSRFICWLLLICGCCQTVAQPVRPPRVCLNGNDWTFLPVRLPFFGYEMDDPARWKTPARDHGFIRAAIENPANNWTRPTPVRVPMAWSSAPSDPGSLEVRGDFDFPHFWQYVHQGIYERLFDVPTVYAGQRIALRFTSVNLKCWVYVNGGLVAPPDQTFTHRGKHPFEIDITPHVKAGSRDNTLRVVVQDFTDAFRGTYPNEDHPDSAIGIDFPLGDRCDYYNKDRGWRNIDSGIIGDVLLFARPPAHVGDIFVTTSVTGQSISVSYQIFNYGERPATVRPVIDVRPNGQDTPVLRFDPQDTITLQPGESMRLEARQAWPNPELWWPHRPILHHLVVTLQSDDQRIDEHRQRFGFREVNIVRSDDDDLRGFYLNGVRTRLFGESVEPTWKDGYTEGVGTSGLYLYNRAYWTQLVNEAKSLGITTLRPHRGMWTEEMFEVADELGMLMIAESTINNGRHSGAVGTLDNQLKVIRDMILTLRNQPSVVVWCLANESNYHPAWAETALALDSSRPLAATQTGDHSALLGPGCSYAMGLDGYEPDIYGRHDSRWRPGLMYVYEDNACYDQPSISERVTAVQKGLTIFRGHRASGYELVSTFYTFQKVFGQPTLSAERRLALEWTDAEAAQPGYRPDFATMPLFDPWTEPHSPRILHPIDSYADNPADFWRRSYSAIAVFDQDYDQRRSISHTDNPYYGDLIPARTLTLHNDDLQDLSEKITVRHEVVDPATDEVISRGSFDLDVPLGGVRRHTLRLDFGSRPAVAVTYRAFKSDVERFAETIHLRALSDETEQHYMEQAGTANFVMRPDEPGFEQQGYHLQSSSSAGAEASIFAVNPAPSPADFVKYNPWIGLAGTYDIFLFVPSGLQGTLRYEVLHDTLNTTGELDLTTSGWVQLGNHSFLMNTGRLENNVRFIPGSPASPSVIGPIKFVRTTGTD